MDDHRVATRDQLERILASPGFARNERLSRFFRYLVERHLAGDEAATKEFLIGIEVFGRRGGFDPKLDSIVRTEAGRLRARLLEYYAGPGAGDALVIDVPKGAYVAVVRQREMGRTTRVRSSKRTTAAAAAAMLALAVAAAVAWYTRPERPPIVIAVLPLENLSRQADSDYFVDGLTDEIIRSLSRIDGLVVRSRTSSFSFKGEKWTVGEAGRQLQADYLLEGSVLREGTQLRINAHLVRVRDDAPMWSARFERQLSDIFAIQDEISLGIVNGLRLQFGQGRRRYETSLEAYDLYLRARALSSEDAGSDPYGFYARKTAFFEQAIAKDSEFAPAFSGLAALAARGSVAFPMNHAADELWKMRGLADRALQLDPLLSEAHAALGLVLAREGLWQESERSFKRALELDRNLSSTYVGYAYWVLAVTGRHEEAITQLKRAHRVDPLAPDVMVTLTQVLTSAGRYDEAVSYSQQLRDKQWLARVRLVQGKFDETIALLSNHPGLAANPQMRGFLGHAYARAGRRTEAESMAAASRFPNERALIFAGLGDKERTIEALEGMTILGAQRLGLYLHYPEMALLKGDPRLQELRKKVGLPL